MRVKMIINQSLMMTLKTNFHKVMSILLKLVDTEAANVNGLKDIGNSLLQ